MKQQDRPQIYTYSDHISFLKDWFSYLKKSQTQFSIRALAQKSGIAVGYLPMVLKGTRALSEKAFQKIIPFLKLNPQEQKFLNLLRQVGEATTHESRLDAVQQMAKLRPYKNANQKDIKVYEYLTKWYYVAIRELVLIEGFQMDQEWIQNKLGSKLSWQEIEEALTFLKEHKFIIQNSDGKWTHEVSELDCKEGIYKISLGQFHRQMLEMAGQAIEKVPRDQRYILGHTVAINAQDFEKIRTILEDSVKKMKNLNNTHSNKSEVYHIEIAAFPLTRLEGK
jgi:uncharacterized protein (TIGR02147 family)